MSLISIGDQIGKHLWIAGNFMSAGLPADRIYEFANKKTNQNIKKIIHDVDTKLIE